MYKLYRDGVPKYKSFYQQRVLKLLRRIHDEEGINTDIIQRDAESISDLALASVKDLSDRIVLVANSMQ